jgi:hypothetical protein
MTNDELTPRVYFVIRHSEFFRISDFGFRHFQNTTTRKTRNTRKTSPAEEYSGFSGYSGPVYFEMQSTLEHRHRSANDIQR